MHWQNTGLTLSILICMSTECLRSTQSYESIFRGNLATGRLLSLADGESYKVLVIATKWRNRFFRHSHYSNNIVFWDMTCFAFIYCILPAQKVISSIAIIL